MKQFRFILKYLQHFISARHTKGFGVHSPYVFNFTRFVIYEKNPFYIFSKIESVRSLLKRDDRKLAIVDYGTGNNRHDQVCNIAHNSLKSKKYGQLLFRIVHFLKPNTVLELGTSLGITTSYLASSSSRINCITMEGSEEIADVAKQTFSLLDLRNICLVVGNIDETLQPVLQEENKIDFIFFDANHQYDTIINYFERSLSCVHAESVVVIDDVYWSEGMEKAWKYIKAHPRVTSTIDLFQLGIVFFNTELNKTHYKMRY